jgi:hypothetical protein
MHGRGASAVEIENVLQDSGIFSCRLEFILYNLYAHTIDHYVPPQTFDDESPPVKCLYELLRRRYMCTFLIHNVHLR